MVCWLAGEATGPRMGIDLWESRERDVEELVGVLPAHIPLAGRPTLVLRLRGSGGGPSLIFNAHSDVVPAPGADRWRFDPWSGRVEDGVAYGRGACDTKGPLIAALWAIRALAESGARLDGDILLEIVPGEEDCVGLGTLTSVARGYRADAAVVLEPTGSLPRCASRAGCRFEITAHGRAVHGTVKWKGQDAIRTAVEVRGVLEALEARWSHDPDPLFEEYPIARPVTVDHIHGGEWQGMVCDRCTLAGYLELLPGDDVEASKRRFEDELRAGLVSRGRSGSEISVRFTETYLGHRLAPESDLCVAAEAVVGSVLERRVSAVHWRGWSAFNSGCEAGVRSALHGTPTLVWGPGDLACAHAVDEHVAWEEVRMTAEMFMNLAASWCGVKEVV